MQFAITTIFALLPVLAFAQIPKADGQCSDAVRATCAASADGYTRCVEKDGVPLCVIECDATSSCTPGCKQQGNDNGLCTIGDYACLCTTGFDPAWGY